MEQIRLESFAPALRLLSEYYLPMAIDESHYIFRKIGMCRSPRPSRSKFMDLPWQLLLCRASALEPALEYFRRAGLSCQQAPTTALASG